MPSIGNFGTPRSRVGWLSAAGSFVVVVFVGLTVAQALGTVPLLIAGGTWVEHHENRGLIGTAFLFHPRPLISGGANVEIERPGQWDLGEPLTCGVYQPPGMAPNRSACWVPTLPLVGDYRARVQAGATLFESVFPIDGEDVLATPQIEELDVSRDEVTFEWTVPRESQPGSFMIRVNPEPSDGTVNGETVVPGSACETGSPFEPRRACEATLAGLSLDPGGLYQAVVWAFSHDVGTPGGLAPPFNIASDYSFFSVRTLKDHEALTPSAYWSFNDCRRGRRQILDSSPGRNHLRLSRPACRQAKYGRGLHFPWPATASTARDVLHFTDELTISAWIHPETLSGRRWIVHKWSDPMSFGMFIDNGRVVFSVALEGGDEDTVSAPVTSGRWTHVAGVFNGPNGTLGLYVDGERKHDLDLGLEGVVLRRSEAPVSLGLRTFRGTLDEVGLYPGALTPHEIASLAGRDEAPYFGSDSFTYPFKGAGGRIVEDRFNLDEMGYDFYVGSLGEGLDGSGSREYCKIGNFAARDILTGVNLTYACPFVYEAALIARPERTHAFWWVGGPDHWQARPQHRRNLRLLGWAQARKLVLQRHRYRHLVGGRTLFADVEPGCDVDPERPPLCLPDPDNPPPPGRGPGRDRSGWDYNDQSRNREVLNGFLSALAALPNVTPGVYTRRNIWYRYFGADYKPEHRDGRRIPFVLWLTGDGTTCSDPSKCNPLRSPEGVQEGFETVKRLHLGNSLSVIWQHHIDKPDWDVTDQNPSGTFVPRPLGAPGD